MIKIINVRSKIIIVWYFSKTMNDLNVVLVEKIAFGAIGSIYSGFLNGDPCVIKITPHTRLYEQELKILKLIRDNDCPHSVLLLNDSFRQENELYIEWLRRDEGWMDLYDFTCMYEFDDRLDEFVPMKMFHKLTRLLLMSVRELHSIGIAHLDLKLENIMIQVVEFQIINLKLIDFNLSIVVCGGGKKLPISGTLEFIPLEMYEQRHTVADPFKVDIWAAGLVLMEVFMSGRENCYGVVKNANTQQQQENDDYFTNSIMRNSLSIDQEMMNKSQLTKRSHLCNKYRRWHRNNSIVNKGYFCSLQLRRNPEVRWIVEKMLCYNIEDRWGIEELFVDN